MGSGGFDGRPDGHGQSDGGRVAGNAGKVYEAQPPTCDEGAQDDESSHKDGQSEVATIHTPGQDRAIEAYNEALQAVGKPSLPTCQRVEILPPAAPNVAAMLEMKRENKLGLDEREKQHRYHDHGNLQKNLAAETLHHGQGNEGDHRG